MAKKGGKLKNKNDCALAKAVKVDMKRWLKDTKISRPKITTRKLCEQMKTKQIKNIFDRYKAFTIHTHKEIIVSCLTSPISNGDF